MNERIKIKIEREIWPQCVSDLTMDTGEVKKNFFDKYKFAELIVKECATQIHNTNLEDVEGGDSSVLSAASTQLKKHFGVE